MKMFYNDVKFEKMVAKQEEMQRIKVAQSIKEQSSAHNAEVWASYYKEKAELAEFEKQPFKYEVGLSIINWVIIDRKKIVTDVPPRVLILDKLSFGVVLFQTEYTAVNLISGEIKCVAEEVIDKWKKALELVNKKQ